MFSHYDPVQKKIVFGPGPAQGAPPPLPMAATDPGPNVIPAVSPESAAAPVAPPPPDFSGYMTPQPGDPAPDGSGFSTPIAPVPARLQAAPAPALPGQPSVASRPMAMPAPAPVVIRPQGRSAAVTLPEISAAVPQQAPAPASNAGGGMMRQPLGAHFQALEKQYGLPEGYLAKTRAIESSNGTRLANPNSSARGDFQFIRSTAAQYGINPMDPYASATAAAKMAAENMKTMQAKGLNPDGADLYAAHQQGIGGYLKLRSGGTTGDAAMRLNGGAGLSGSQMLAKWRTAFDAAKPGNLGEGFTPAPSADANKGQGPTVAAAQAQGGVQNLNPAPDNTYKGGILGLFGAGDQSAPGMNKDFSGKMGDMLAQPGGGAIGSIAKALPALFGGGGSSRPAPAQFGPAPEDHKPDASLLAFLDPKRRRQGVQ